MPGLTLVTKNTFLHLQDPEDPAIKNRSGSAPPKIVASVEQERRQKQLEESLRRVEQEEQIRRNQQLERKKFQEQKLERHRRFELQNRENPPQAQSGNGYNWLNHAPPTPVGPENSSKYKRTDLLRKYGGAEAMEKGEVTSLMIRHIPCRCTTEDMMAEVDQGGFKGLYDFFYMPCDRRQPSKHNLGYAFMNFSTPEAAARFQKEFAGYRFGGEGCRSLKECAISPAAVQGLQNNWTHFRRTAVLRSDRRPAFLPSSMESNNAPAKPITPTMR